MGSKELEDQKGLIFAKMPLTTLELIISKLDFKSYCQMQQTCKFVVNLVETSKNIRIRLNGRLETAWTTGEDGSVQLSFSYRNMPNWKTPYGIRADSLGAPRHKQRGSFAGFYDALMKYRVTVVSFSPGFAPLSKVQFLTLLNTLKPVKCYVDCTNNNNYEAFNEAKLPDRQVLRLTVNPERAPAAIIKVLPYWSEVYLDVTTNARLENDTKNNDFLANISKNDELLKWLLRFLSSEALPTLDKLDMHLLWKVDITLRSTEELMEIYRSFAPTIEDRLGRKFDLKCIPEANDGCCMLLMSKESARIYYEKGPFRPEQWNSTEWLQLLPRISPDTLSRLQNAQDQ